MDIQRLIYKLQCEQTEGNGQNLIHYLSSNEALDGNEHSDADDETLNEPWEPRDPAIRTVSDTVFKWSEMLDQGRCFYHRARLVYCDCESSKQLEDLFGPVD